MNNLIGRLRAALYTPAATILILLLVAGMLMMRGKRSETGLEERTEALLAQVAGIGTVDVVIRTRTVNSQQTGRLIGSAPAEEIPCGALAVAAGADDPIVRMQIEQALCALLGLDASSVDVISTLGS